MVESEPLRTNVSIGLQESGGPAKQKMARIGEDMFGIPGYMDTSGSCDEGVLQPCEYTKYLTYTTVASTGLPGELCIFCFPFWGCEFTFCKVLPQWGQVLATCVSGGAV